MSYRGTVISGGVARQKPLGTGQPSVWTTTSSGVTGIDALYTAAGANLADGDIGIIGITGAPILFSYSDAAKNWVRVNPRLNSSRNYFVEASTTNGFRNQDATTVDWTEYLSTYSYSAPTHTITASGGNGYVITDDSAHAMNEIGFIVLHKSTVQTGATNYPFIDLRRDDGASPYPNLRLRRTATGDWGIEASPQVSTGVAFNLNTEYSWEVYFNYASNRCWVYQDYAANPTVINNTAIALPTTSGTNSGLAIQVSDGVWELEGLALGHLVTEL